MARPKNANSKEYPRTISPELHDAWKQLARKKDQTAISEFAGFSQPVINRALLYGHVSTPEVKDKINQFFTERLEKEKIEAKNLINLNNG